MAAAPETQFGQAGLTVPGFTPSVYSPGSVNVPTGAGELWAQVGKTALDAGKQVLETLMNSPLNPEVKEKMKYGIDAYKRGQEVIDWARSKGELGYWLGKAGPAGYEQLSPANISDPTLAAQFLKGIIPTPPKPPPPPPPTTDGTTETKTYPTISSDQGDQPPTPDTSLEKRMEKPTTQVAAPPSTMFAAAAPAQPPAPTQFQGPTQPETAAAVQEALARNRFASAQPGVPTGYQPPTQAYPTITGGQAGPSSAELAAWQAQNVHPIASPSAFIKWYKDNVSTNISGATYSMNGGVNGEPAFIVHSKGGGNPVITASQIARTPSGRAMLASENPTEVLEQQHNQAQAAAAAAVTPPQTAPPQTYPTIASDQGAAPAAPSYNPAPYQQAIAQQTASPQNLTASTQKGAGSLVAGKPAHPEVGKDLPVTAPKPDHQPSDTELESLKANKGSQITDTTGITWKYDDDPASEGYGRLMAILPGQTSTLTQQRWYLGTTGYKDYPLAESNLRQKFRDEFQGKQPGKVYTDEESKTLPIETIRQKLQQAAYYNSHPPAPSNDPQIQRVYNLADVYKGLQRQEDIAQWALDNKLDPKEFIEAEISNSKEAAERNKLLPGYLPTEPGAYPGNAYTMAWALWHGSMAHGRQPNDFVDNLAATIKYNKEHMAQTPLQKFTLAGAPEEKTVTMNIPSIGSIQAPMPGDTAAIRAIDRMTSGQDVPTSIKEIQRLKALYGSEFLEATRQAEIQGKRLTDDQTANRTALVRNKPMPDAYNNFRDAAGKLVNPYSQSVVKDEKTGQFRLSTRPVAPSPSPSATPPPRTVTQTEVDAAPRPKTQADFDALKQGDLFIDRDGKPKFK